MGEQGFFRGRMMGRAESRRSRLVGICAGAARHYDARMPKQRKRTRLVLLVTGVLAVVVVAAVVRYRDELVARYVLRRDFERLSLNAQGRPEYRHRETGIVFVALPGGSFQMGSPESEAGHLEREGPVHEVRLSPFLIAKYEITQSQWEKVMRNRPSKSRGDDLPVESVSWEECNDFCERTGLALPTEAQWEYACRAGSETAYYSGDSEGDLKRVGWYRGGRKSHAVGEKPANDFGLHDMHGNVEEWCLDSLESDFYSKPEAMENDPLCASGSEFRVTRGGSGNGSAVSCRSAFRADFRQAVGNSGLGFRPTWSSP